jgi:hypothetical protein
MHPRPWLTRARAVVPFPRSAGKCLIVAAPVKGARTLASRVMAQAPPLTAIAPHENPAPIGQGRRPTAPLPPAAAPEKELRHE